MYIGHHRERPGDGEERDGIRIPENYAGNAFTAPPASEEENEAPTEMHEEATAEAIALPMPLPRARGKSGFFPRLDKLFSSDALLIILAILLSGDGEGEELSILLLLLLLF